MEGQAPMSIQTGLGCALLENPHEETPSMRHAAKIKRDENVT
jgi:hypothetical protein